MVLELKNNYGRLFEDELINEILQVGTYKEVSAGAKLMEIGSYVKGMPLLVSGAIKVLREDKNGDELLLYYLEKGDTCSMTMTCCLGQTKSEIRAIAETDTKLIMVPIEKMEIWTAKYKSWRSFVFDSYHNRLNEMFRTLDSIAFDKMDERLLNYLKEKVRIENNGRIQLYRNYIEVINLN